MTVVSCFTLLQQINGNLDCIGTCYSGRLLPETQDIFRGKHLKGFSYKNTTTDDPRKCYLSCAKDCLCKACQMKDKNCELLDEDRSSKAESFAAGSGYVYYDLKQIMCKEKSYIITRGVCYNGCCRSNPCLNGGTCTEQCQSPKKKFSCNCGNGFYGKVCESPFYSCIDVLKYSIGFPKDSVYSIKRSDKNHSIPLYCAFVNPNQAWTLIESFARSYKHLFSHKPFNIGYGRYLDLLPSWDRFRVNLSRMQYIRSKSTLFRATCDFPKRNGKLTPDFLLGSLSDVDIINDINILDCKKYTLVNIRGHECKNCTAFTAHGMREMHFHLDVTHERCEFSSQKNWVSNLDSFGYYVVTDSQSICTAHSHSTTQW